MNSGGDSTITNNFGFEKLRLGQLGISAISGASFAEAAEYCLQYHNHTRPVLIRLTGDFADLASIEWRENDMRLLGGTYADTKRAAEDGAYGVAIVLATEITGIPNAMKSPQGTGFDYWLTSADDNNFNFFEARLEVSGLFKGNQSEVAQRQKTKIEQTKRSDDTLLPAYVCIVEFGAPEARITQRVPGEER